MVSDIARVTQKPFGKRICNKMSIVNNILRMPCTPEILIEKLVDLSIGWT